MGLDLGNHFLVNRLYVYMQNSLHLLSVVGINSAAPRSGLARNAVTDVTVPRWRFGLSEGVEL